MLALTRGRPSTYTQDVGQLICERIIGGEALWEICADREMPERQTVLIWVHRFPEFAAEYARARSAAHEAANDFMDRVARDGGKDIVVEDIDGLRVERVDHEHINRSKLIVDMVKWRQARLRPDLYGDRLAHQMLDEHGKPARTGGVVIIIDGAPGKAIE